MAKVIHLLFDGLVEPRNPGGYTTYGVWIDGPELHHEMSGYLGHGVITLESGLQVQTTNNLAEFSALVFGLQWCLDNLPRDSCLRCCGDSKLVVEQVNGNWRCNPKHLRLARNKVRILMENFNDIELAWIPRVENAPADSLSRKAYHTKTGQWPPERHKR